MGEGHTLRPAWPHGDPKPAPGLEVHEHKFVSGPRANRSWLSTLEHSHEGGDVPHTHPDTGPSSYTIDKDEWFRATGLKGAGRKRFTKAPTGEQLPTILRTAEENAFQIVVCAPPPGHVGEGGGHHAAARMIQAFRLRPIVRDGR